MRLWQGYLSVSSVAFSENHGRTLQGILFSIWVLHCLELPCWLGVGFGGETVASRASESCMSAGQLLIPC